MNSRSDTEAIEQILDGELYRKPLSNYVRYIERGETEEIATTVKFASDGTVKMLRSGTICSELEFALGTHTKGSLSFERQEMQLSIFTHHLSNRLQAGLGQFSLSYDLQIGDAPAGRFEIEFSIEAH